MFNQNADGSFNFDSEKVNAALKEGEKVIDFWICNQNLLKIKEILFLSYPGTNRERPTIPSSLLCRQLTKNAVPSASEFTFASVETFSSKNTSCCPL